MLILYYFFLRNPLLLLIPYILQVIPYFFILRKLGMNGAFALLPFVSEYKFARKVFKEKGTFLRPLIISTILVGYAYYVTPYVGAGLYFVIAAFVIYGVILARVYSRISKAFGKSLGFRIGAAILTPLFLFKLAFDKSEFTEPTFKPDKPHGKFFLGFKKVAIVGLAVLEILVVIAGGGFLAIRERVPSIIVNALLDDVYFKTSKVTSGTGVISRKDIINYNLDSIIAENKTRDYFFADHTNDKEAVVYVYICGADLEDGQGLASANITQMIDATKKGKGLKFVIETGGSNRWFTKGIDNNSYGRYEIYDGKLKKLESLDSTLNMANGKNLEDFLVWGKNNYKTDRQILLLWDHGGGFTMGYALDKVNGNGNTMPVSELVKAIDHSGMKFDLIGFDACLMQDIEVAAALEPYADYFVASEESEGGFGWFYTYAFGRLAKNPGISTQELGREIVASYDPYNEALSTGTPAALTPTLSLVDLTLINSAYGKLSSFFQKAKEAIIANPQAFANLSVAADHSYNFSNMQIDLLGFLLVLEDLDYNEVICDKAELNDLIQTIEASIVYRNAASARGVHGMAFTFGNSAIFYYSDTYKQLKNFANDEQEQALSTYYSIIAAQLAKSKPTVPTSGFDLNSIVTGLVGSSGSLTNEEWYIKGFEDYDKSEAFIDIPLIEVDGGYVVDIPEVTWDIISDAETMVYQRVDGMPGVYSRYLGNDYICYLDDQGHYMVATDDNWTHINGQIVCYEIGDVKHTDDGDIYTGKVKARLNDKTDIYLIIEWETVNENEPENGKVVGYVPITDLPTLEEKGTQNLEAGDSIQFLFDYYDAQGKLVKTDVAGKKIRITKQNRLKVTDSKMDPCTIEFGGVLKDVYQRRMVTEMIEAVIK